MSEGYERMKARRAGRDASGIAYVDCSIYENMAASVVRSGVTLAQVHDYGVAVEIAAALNATPSQGLDAATVKRCAQIVRECGPQNPKHDWTEHARIRAHMRDRILSEFALALATDPHQHGGKGE